MTLTPRESAGIDLVEAILNRWDWDRPAQHFDHNGLNVHVRWVDGTDEDPPTLEIIGRTENADFIRDLAYDAVGQWFSEASNNDACEIELLEVTAHFHLNPLTKGLLTDDEVGRDIYVRARVLDYLT